MSSFLVKLDENLGRLHAELLREHGYDADRVHDEGISGAYVLRRVLAEQPLKNLQGCLAVADRDITRIRRP